jgi:hypothetical protein
LRHSRTPTKSKAAQYGLITLTATNSMPALVTNQLALVTGNVIGVTRYEEVALMVSFNATNTSLAPVSFVFRYGLDTNNISTTNSVAGSVVKLDIPANNTSTVNFVTNVYMGAIGYLVLDNIGNNSTTVGVTNIVVKYAREAEVSGAVVNNDQ